MAFELPKIDYSAKIMSVTVGKGGKALTMGGESAYPFHTWEGEMPNRPVLAMEIWDMDPGVEWPEACKKPFEGVLGDPGAWAKKCVEEYGAEAIVIQLKSTDPNADDASAESASATVGRVLDAVDVPVIVWGVANPAKDTETLKKIAEDHSGKGLLLGPVDEANHKAIGAAALAYGQSLISSSPIDVNLAKQLNILLGNLGVGMDKLVVDPTTGGLGYGMEYSYSVMERIRQAGLLQDDDKLLLPMINNVGNEVWKSKEAKLEGEDSAAANLGDDAARGVLMESSAATAYLLAGSNLLILRHPETVKLVKGFLAKMSADRAPAAARVASDRPKAALIPGAKAPAPKAAPKAAPKPAAKAAPKAAPKPAAAAPAAAAPAAAAPAAAAPAPAAAAAAAPAVDAAAAAAAEEARKQAEAAQAAQAAAAAKAAAAAEAEASRKEREAKKAQEMAAIEELRRKRAEKREKMEAAHLAAQGDEEEDFEPGPYQEVGVAGPGGVYIERFLSRWEMRGDGYLSSKKVLTVTPAVVAKPKAEPKVEPVAKAPEPAPATQAPAPAAAAAPAEIFMHSIGENLNVIKTEIGKAFKDRNPEPIQKLALAEKARGINWIDINLGPARKGGPELMEWVVKTVQEVVPDVPLALDTSNIEAIEAGLAVHKGTALVNSVMARPERYTKMIPIVAKYKADVIALLWGPDGLPRDETERSALAVELVYAMNEAGIANEQIFVDPIITPVNIQQPQLMNTLAFMEMLQDIAPGAKSTNGLSNISNGTPWREPLNQVYMIMLQRAGMFSCIMDYEDELILEISAGGRKDLVEIVHKVQDGLINSPMEVPEGMSRTYVAAAQAILGKILYSDSWFEIEGGAKPEGK